MIELIGISLIASSKGKDLEPNGDPGFLVVSPPPTSYCPQRNDQRFFPSFSRSSSRRPHLALPLHLGRRFSKPNCSYSGLKAYSRGFRVGSHKVKVSHLQFADNTFILAERDENNVRVLNWFPVLS